MLCLSSYILSNCYPHCLSTASIKKARYHSRRIYISAPFPFKYKSSQPMSLLQPALVTSSEEAKEIDTQEPKLKWYDIGPDITEAQKETISQLPARMTNRCKALMKRIICFSPEDENLHLMLAAWVKVMKPQRADWLLVLKEMKGLENPLFSQVMEYALVEASFEANIRDYTKLIDSYAKHSLLKDAENTFVAMKNRGFPCDQVTMTVLINMYSKAGDLNQAKEAFDEIKLLGLPLDKRAYGSMMMGYIRAGMPELAESLMREMEAIDMYAGSEVYKALLRAYSTVGDADGAQRVFDSIQLAGIVPDARICALLVSAYCAGGWSDKARSVLENMRRAGVEPSDKCIALMLGAYEKENNLGEGLALLMGLEKQGIVIAEEASEVLAGWFRRLGVVHEVEHVLRKFALKKGRIRFESSSMSRKQS